MISGFDAGVARDLARFTSREREGRRIALFDADGTLWRGDVGEAFFKHQLERGTIRHAPKKDAWNTYLKESVDGNSAQAYGWLAQWNAGVEEVDLMRWCDEFFRDQWTKFVFEPMREFTHGLLNAGFEVWVVTGSPRWIVQAGVKGFGIPSDRVLGSSVLVEKGVLTDKIENEVPYRAGKARLVEKIVAGPPLMVAGNTYWDKEMMLMASELALAICSEDKGEPNHESEQRLQRLAETNKWLTQRF
ncbi:MAG: haloacid dehalogenase-like hydrolase [Deltaproteobacteria bacterium]|nr:haloacid dehalogenase-like hydrolase [Deltaproteobacteria bacterium]